ncbi:MAG: hypothetical protein ACLFPB_05335 [Desulfovermiculus sp.]
MLYNPVLRSTFMLRLEVSDRVLDQEGKLDVDKAQPMMMVGSKQGMHFCTVRDVARFEPFSAMFADGQDPDAPQDV